MDRHKTTIFSAAAAVAAFVVFLPALNNGFVNWDDWAYVYDSAVIRSIDAGFLKLIFTEPLISNYHPLTMLSLAIDYSVWGLNPLGYHIVNIALHSINTFLAGMLAGMLAREAGAEDGPSGRAPLIALLAALFFGLHPMKVEPAVWISSRKDLLCGFFYLLSVLGYLRYSRAGDLKTGLYALSLTAFILAILSKPMAVSLPIALLILDFYPLRRPLKARIIVEKAPFFAISLASAYLTIWAQKGAIISKDVLPLPSRLIIAMRSLAFYVYKTIVPLNLAPYYPYPEKIGFDPEYILAAALLAAISAFSIFYLKKSRLFIAAWVYFLVSLVSVIGIVQVGTLSAADRYMYLPGLAPFILMAAGLTILFDRLSIKKLTCVVALILAAVMGILTVRQTTVWKDSITLWTYEIGVYPKKAPLPYANLASAYKDSGDYGKSIENFSIAIELNPGDPGPWSKRAYVYMLTRDYSPALGDFTKAIGLSTDPETKSRNFYNRGIAYKTAGGLDQALEDFSKAIELDPSFAGAYNNRGGVLRRLGRFSLAIEDYKRSIEIDPSAPAYYNLGLVYAEIKETELARSNVQKAAGMGLKEAQEFLTSGY